MTTNSRCGRNADASCGRIATATCTDGRTDVLTEMHSPSDEGSSSATHAGGLNAESLIGHGTARRQQSEDPTTRAVALRPFAVRGFALGGGAFDVQSFPGRPLARTTSVRAASTPLTRHRAASSATQRHHEADHSTLQKRPDERLPQPSSTNMPCVSLQTPRSGYARTANVSQHRVSAPASGYTNWTTREWFSGFVACSPIARWHGRSDGSNPLRPSRELTADRCKETIALCPESYRLSPTESSNYRAATGVIA